MPKSHQIIRFKSFFCHYWNHLVQYNIIFEMSVCFSLFCLCVSANPKYPTDSRKVEQKKSSGGATLTQLRYLMLTHQMPRKLIYMNIYLLIQLPHNAALLLINMNLYLSHDIYIISKQKIVPEENITQLCKLSKIINITL